jgi:hypothetical protein
MFVTQSFNYVLPPLYTTESTFKLKTYWRKAPNLKRTRIPRVDDDVGQSALPHKYHEIAFISIVLYTTEIHFHARNLLLKGSKFKEEKGYHELMMVVLTCCPTVL